MINTAEHRISLYTLPLDRFAFFRAKKPRHRRDLRSGEGVVTTKPLLITAPFLGVNIEATSANAEVAVELLGPRCSRSGVEWSRIPGFSWVNISGTNMLRRCVRWPSADGGSLWTLQGRTVRIRFVLKGDAKLFAFMFSPTCIETPVPESTAWQPDESVDEFGNELKLNASYASY